MLSASLLSTSQLIAANVSWSSLVNTSGESPSAQSIIVVQAGDRLTFDAAVGTNEIQVKGILIFGELSWRT